MNILFIPSTNSGVTFWRMQNFAVAMHRNGYAGAGVFQYYKDLNDAHPWQWECTKPVVQHAIVRALDESAQQADVIVVQMVHTFQALALIRALRDRFPNKPILAEIDDNMISLPTYNEAEQQFRPGSKYRDLALSQFKEADAMIVSTAYLRDEVYFDINERIHVVPNSIDFNLWGAVKPRARKGIRIIYTAGGNHDEDIRILAPIIPRIVDRHPEVKFVFFHYAPPDIEALPGVEVLRKWVPIGKFPQSIASLGGDIGIAPLVDNAFNRGKSNIRWLEYSALRIPTVASNVGHFRETITNGVDGFLADNPEQFEAHLEALIKDKKTRKNIGVRAYQTVYDKFNVDRTSKRYVEILEEAIKTGPVGVVPEEYVPKGLIPAGEPLSELQ